MLKSLTLEKTYQYLLIFLAFLLPLTVFGANVIILLIVIIWAFSGDYKNKFNQIIKSKLMLASILFFFLHVVGLIWTEDLRWGVTIIRKMWYFLLLLPILFTVTRREHIKLYISAFLLAVFISEFASYLIFFEIIPPFKYATLYDPTPFMSHISYNPILAFAIYLMLHEVFFNHSISLFNKYAYSFLALTATINMFITGGRAGQAMFFAMLAIFIFQYFRSQLIKAILVIIIVLPSIFFIFYQTSDIFQDRVDQVKLDIEHYNPNHPLHRRDTSVGLRIAMTVNSLELISKKPFIGYGTGDFPIEYEKVNVKNTPELSYYYVTNPHNMYILVLMQLGLIGLVSFLLIFYYQIRLSFVSKNIFNKNAGLALPLLFLLINIGDSYLLGHYTTLMYVFFSSFLYKDFEKH
jgi:O-antigen ligase